MLRYILLATTILSLCTADIYAQTRRRNTSRVWEGVTINPKIGPSLYMGDMVDKSNWRLTTGASVEKELLPWLSGRFEMTGGLLAGVMNAGSDIGFDTKYVDITLGATVFPVDLIGGYYNKRLVNPYVSLMGGFGIFNVKKNSDCTAAWAQAGDGNVLAPMVCGVLGAKYRINKNFGVNLEINGHLPFSDEIDGHNGWSPESAPDETTGAYMNWNDGKNDFYYTVMVGMTYKIQETQWRVSSNYNRKTYVKNRKAYKRNANRMRRR